MRRPAARRWVGVAPRYAAPIEFDHPCRPFDFSLDFAFELTAFTGDAIKISIRELACIHKLSPAYAATSP